MKLSYCLLILTVSADLSIGFTPENVAFNRTVAFGSFNASLHTVSQALVSSPVHHDIIAKEGTSILIECRLNISQYEYILWYNSRGHLLEQKDEGELSCCFLSSSIPLLYSIWKPLGLYYHFPCLSSHFYSWEIRREQDRALCPLACGMWIILESCPSPSILLWCPTESFRSRGITVFSIEEINLHPTRYYLMFLFIIALFYTIFFQTHELNTVLHNLWPFPAGNQCVNFATGFFLKHGVTYYIYFLVYAPVRLWKLTQFVMVNNEIHAI